MEKRLRLIILLDHRESPVGSASTGCYERDGKIPPITAENFSIEFYRYFARGLRARWIRLSSAKLRAEARESWRHFKKPSEFRATSRTLQTGGGHEHIANGKRSLPKGLEKVEAAIVDAIVAARAIIETSR